MANAGAKLSSFPEVNDIQAGDMFPLLSDGNTNAKIDYATLANAIIAKEVERATAAENKLESKKADKTPATASANGLMSATDKKAIDREFFRLLPKGGTYIPANADLNSIEYLKVGIYYNPSGAQSVTIKNIPAGIAFIMYVLAPTSEVYDNENTAQWVYRLRIFITFLGNEIFVQYATSGATAGSFNYGPWVKMTNSDDLGAVSKQFAKNTAQIETAGTATSAHSVGEYVMISNALYKVTASVAKGDTWTIGTNVTAANIGSEISSLKSDLANKLYPVGSIYMSVNATNPAELFGGTWEQIKDRFLLAAGDAYAAGSTGGEATHKLTIDEMPNHIHEMAPWMWAVSANFSTGTYNVPNADNGNADSYSSVKSRQKQYSGSTGGGLAHNNMPPYLAVYMWKRIA